MFVNPFAAYIEMFTRPMQERDEQLAAANARCRELETKLDFEMRRVATLITALQELNDKLQMQRTTAVVVNGVYNDAIQKVRDTRTLLGEAHLQVEMTNLTSQLNEQSYNSLIAELKRVREFLEIAYAENEELSKRLDRTSEALYHSRARLRRILGRTGAVEGYIA